MSDLRRRAAAAPPDDHWRRRVLTTSVIRKSTKPAVSSAESWDLVASPKLPAMRADVVCVPASRMRA
jgi:hypothetical protein